MWLLLLRLKLALSEFLKNRTRLIALVKADLVTRQNANRQKKKYRLKQDADIVTPSIFPHRGCYKSYSKKLALPSSVRCDAFTSILLLFMQIAE